MACMHSHAPLHRRRVATWLKNALTGDKVYSRAKRGWRVIGGVRKFFRSRMEANYARYLTFMGVKWEYEPKTFWFTGIKRGCMSYTPDFYLPVEDRFLETKGWMDKKSKTKMKRMKKYHPNVRVDIVDWKAFKAVEKALGKSIPEWEFESRASQ